MPNTAMYRSIVLCFVGLVALTGCSDKKPVAASQVVAAQVPPQITAQASAASDTRIDIAGSADRLAPAVVPAIEREGVRYQQAEDGRTVGANQVAGVLVASAVGNGKPLWTLVVYCNKISPNQETDAQLLFFKSMSFDPDGRLRIVNETDRAFLVDVQKRTVSAVDGRSDPNC